MFSIELIKEIKSLANEITAITTTILFPQHQEFLSPDYTHIFTSSKIHVVIRETSAFLAKIYEMKEKDTDQTTLKTTAISNVDDIIQNQTYLTTT